VQIISNTSLIKSIYSYCKEQGYIAHLVENIKTDRFNERPIEQNGLDILDAVRCITDFNRSNILLDEITRIIHKGNVVLDAGFGSGILAFKAAEIGANVTALELNNETFEFAKKLYSYLLDKKVLNNSETKLLLTDAIKYIPTIKPDVIISENIYTGCFYEKQVQIMNNLIPHINVGGKVIPQGLRSGITLINAEFPHNPINYELFIPLDYSNGINHKELSDSVIYSELNFEVQNKTSIDTNVTLQIKASGMINAVLIWSEVLLYEGKKIGRKDTNFLNDDIIISLPKTKSVTNGQTLELKINYECGALPSDISIQLND
jgi:predicted RNA methylase